MPFYLDLDDDGQALWVSECPARCVTIDLLHCPLEGDISCSLSLTSQCLPTLWRRILFSLRVVSPWWRSASHDQEMSGRGATLRRLREWLASHPVGPSENEEKLIGVNADGGLEITFEVNKRSGLAFALVMRFEKLDDAEYWVALIQPSGRGRWRLAWDNIFNKYYVEEWGHLSLGSREVADIIAWIDSVLPTEE